MLLICLCVISLNYFFQEDIQGMLSYCLKICLALIQNRRFSNTVLRVLTKLYMSLDTPDYINVCQVSDSHNILLMATPMSIVSMRWCYLETLPYHKTSTPDDFMLSCKEIRGVRLVKMTSHGIWTNTQIMLYIFVSNYTAGDLHVFSNTHLRFSHIYTYMNVYD